MKDYDFVSITITCFVNSISEAYLKLFKKILIYYFTLFTAYLQIGSSNSSISLQQCDIK